MGGTAVPPLPPHALLEITEMSFTPYTNESQSDSLPRCSFSHLIREYEYTLPPYTNESQSDSLPPCSFSH